MKPMRSLLLTGLFAGSAALANAQIFFTEGFEGVVGGNGLPAGWTETGLSTDGIYNVGDDATATSAYITFPAALQGTKFAYTNDDACDCDKSADRLILPVQNFTGMTGVNLIFDAFMDGQYGGVGTVEVSTNGGTTWTTVFTMTNDQNAWQNDITVSLSAYAGMSNVSVSFLYNDGGAWADAMGIDEVRLQQLASANDLATTSFTGEYVLIPQSQVVAMPLSAGVANVGAVNVTNAIITAKVFLSPDFVTPIHTATSTPAALNAGATGTFSAGNYTPSAVGTYVYQYIISSGTADGNASNDTTEYVFAVTPTTYSREDGSVTNVIGAGTNVKLIMGTLFQINAATTVDSLFFATQTQMNGDSVQAVVYSLSAGIPTTRIGQSAVELYTLADEGVAAVRTLKVNAIGGGALNLAPGTYMFGIEEDFSGDIDLLASTYIYTPNKFFVSIGGAAFVDVESLLTFTAEPLIRPILVGAAACAVTATTATTPATCTAASGTATVTPAGGAAPYSFVWNNGQTAATATGLAAGTYTVTVTDNAACTATASATVTSSSITLTSSTAVTAATCGNTDGAVNLTVSNGTAPYTYAWSNSTTAEDLSNVGPGTYNVTITDANGCTGTASAQVTVGNGPNSTAVVTNVSCNGVNDGAINISVTGGSTPYFFAWSANAGGATTEGGHLCWC